MKLKNKIASACLATALGIGLAASPALAVTGGNLANSCNSYPVSILTWISSTQAIWVARCQSTAYWSQYAGKVQGFKITDTGCYGKSQYSGSSWPYKGGTYYPYSSNNLYLTITVQCVV